MMEMYREYIKERKGFDLIESPEGFIEYQIKSPGVFIAEIYVRKEHRGSHVGKHLVDQVAALAKEQGCSLMSANIYAAAGGSTEALSAALKVGFKFHSSGVGYVTITREV